MEPEYECDTTELERASSSSLVPRLTGNEARLARSSMSSSKRVCPGCHGTDFITFSDGFGDGDLWFHCFTCGTESCVDYEDCQEYFSGSKPPQKSPPYHDKDPLPRKHIWPDAMTPSQICSWMATTRVKLDSSGNVVQQPGKT